MTVLEVGVWLVSILVLFVCAAIIIGVQMHFEVECVRAGGVYDKGHCVQKEDT